MLGVFNNSETTWKSIKKPSIPDSIQLKLNNIEYSVFEIPRPGSTIEVVLIKPKQINGKIPLMVMPHGGMILCVLWNRTSWSVNNVLFDFYCESSRYGYERVAG